MQLGALNIFGRLKMVRSYNNFFSVEHFVDTTCFKHFYRRRPGHIYKKHNIQLCINKLTRSNFFFPSRLCQYLFSNCHTHFLRLYVLNFVFLSFEFVVPFRLFPFNFLKVPL